MLSRATRIDHMPEPALLRAAKSGDEGAVEFLITGYTPLRRLIASFHRQIDPGRTMTAELNAAANLAALEALDRFDPERGVRYTTFAYHPIRGAMLTTMFPRAEARAARPGTERERVQLVALERRDDADGEIVSVEADLRRINPSIGDDAGFLRIEKREQSAAVREFVSSLPSTQREITTELFWEDRTQAEIAEARGTSRPAVSRTLARVVAHGRRHFASVRDELAA